MTPQTEPTTREAQPTDTDQLVDMRFLLQHHLEASNPGIWHITEEGKQRIGQDIEQMHSDEDGRVLVSEIDGSIVGYTYGKVSRRTHYTPRSVGFIHGIYVREPYRRRGIEIQLVRELYSFFSAENVEEVNLRYVLGNREGEEFWKALGFKPVIHTANTSLKALETPRKRTHTIKAPIGNNSKEQRAGNGEQSLKN